MAATAGEQVSRLRWGAGCSLVSAAVALVLWGPVEARAAFSLGMVATVLQLIAAWRTGTASIDQMRVYSVGVVLRFIGVLLLGVMVSLDPRRFPPLPSALGYLGTLLPLLYRETRRTR